MAHILSDFDPIKTEQILKESTHEEITDAFLSRKFYTKVEDG